MMICKADFEELFPHLFGADEDPTAQAPCASEDGAGDRMQQDDGRVVALPAKDPAPRVGPAPAPYDGHDQFRKSA